MSPERGFRNSQRNQMSLWALSEGSRTVSTFCAIPNCFHTPTNLFFKAEDVCQKKVLQQIMIFQHPINGNVLLRL